MNETFNWEAHRTFEFYSNRHCCHGDLYVATEQIFMVLQGGNHIKLDTNIGWKEKYLFLNLGVLIGVSDQNAFGVRLAAAPDGKPVDHYVFDKKNNMEHHTGITYNRQVRIL